VGTLVISGVMVAAVVGIVVGEGVIWGVAVGSKVGTGVGYSVISSIAVDGSVAGGAPRAGVSVGFGAQAPDKEAKPHRASQMRAMR
jgi:hypothetical protein